MRRIARTIALCSFLLSACTSSPTLSQQLPVQWRAFRLNPTEPGRGAFAANRSEWDV